MTSSPKTMGKFGILPLLFCARHEGGMPLYPMLKNFETSLADILRADTVQTLKANLHFLNVLDDAFKKALHVNQSSDILQHSQNRPTGDRWLKF